MRFLADFGCGRKTRSRILFEFRHARVAGLVTAAAVSTTSNLTPALVYCSRTSRRSRHGNVVTPQIFSYVARQQLCSRGRQSFWAFAADVWSRAAVADAHCARARPEAGDYFQRERIACAG